MIGTQRSAVLSPCRTYRYTLTRIWDGTLPILAVIGLNPSIADETVDDPTIRRCVTYARDWGFGGIVMLNLFAFRSTDPVAMKRAHAAGQDVIGPDNTASILAECRGRTVLMAWGVHGRLANRDMVLTALLRTNGQAGNIVCLGLTKDRAPKHPLYLSKTLRPIPYTVGT